jgi:hypothetical protein
LIFALLKKPDDIISGLPGSRLHYKSFMENKERGILLSLPEVGFPAK